MKYSEEIRELAVNLYKDNYSLQAIKELLEEQKGSTITTVIISSWVKSAGMELDREPRKAKDGIIHLRHNENDKRTIAEIEKDFEEEMLERLKEIKQIKDKEKASKEVEKILQQVGYDRPTIDYQIVLEQLRLGKYKEAVETLDCTKMQYGTNLGDIENEVRLKHASDHVNTMNKVVKLQKNLLELMRFGGDIRQTYFEKLNDAEAKNRNAEYKNLLMFGLNLFPDDLQLKGRTASFIIKQGEPEQARKFLISSLKPIEYSQLSEREMFTYLGLRNTLINLEKNIQIQTGKRNFTGVKKLAEKTVQIDSSNIIPQFQLIHIAILEGNYQEAGRRIHLTW